MPRSRITAAGLPAALLALVGCLSGSSLPGGPAAEPAAAEPAPSESAPIPLAAVEEAKIRVVGRSVALDANNPFALRFSWPGVGVGVRFVGSNLWATLAEVSTGQADISGVHHNRLDVFVDGTWQPQQIVLSATPQRFELARGLSRAEHTVWLRKRTESQFAGRAELSSIDLGPAGTLLAAPPRRDRAIEVVGASNEAGFGVEGVDPCGYSDLTSNQSRAWPQVLADTLSADLSDIAVSGIGLMPMATTGPLARTLVDLYPRADGEDADSRWDFAAAAALDVILIDVGGNDYRSLKLTDSAARQKFVALYGDLVDMAAASSPKAAIYLMLNGVQHGDKRAALSLDVRAVVAAAGRRGLAQVRFLELTEYTGTTYGCDGHPDVALQKAMAAQVAERLKEDLGW